MANVSAEIKNGELIVRIPMNSKPVPSATGKTLVVASTHGNIPLDIQVDGKTVIFGCNAYIRRD